ncbi:MAG: haloacid dehalogenase [Chloroflexi bacterium]|nr:haloacid dehalogenase [Chloroflexota bacterium]
MENLEEITEKIRQAFTDMDQAREKLLPMCRNTIRHASQAIRAIHRQEFGPARESLDAAAGILAAAASELAAYPELRGAGLMRDAQKEYAEGNITLALVKGKKLPAPAELNVEPAAYLNGMGEAVGEIRRYLLDAMRRGDLSRGEELLGVMDDIYGALVTMDFPDALTGGLRRTTDSVRGILEKTRSDLTLAIRQKELEDKLRQP